MTTEQRERDAPVICPYCAKRMTYHKRINAVGEIVGVYICPGCEAHSPQYVSNKMLTLSDDVIRGYAYGQAMRAASARDLRFVKEHPDELTRAYLTAVKDSTQSENCGTCLYQMNDHNEEPCKQCIKGKSRWQWRGWRVVDAGRDDAALGK